MVQKKNVINKMVIHINIAFVHTDRCSLLVCAAADCRQEMEWRRWEKKVCSFMNSVKSIVLLKLFCLLYGIRWSYTLLLRLLVFVCISALVFYYRIHWDMFYLATILQHQSCVFSSIHFVQLWSPSLSCTTSNCLMGYLWDNHLNYAFFFFYDYERCIYNQ